MTREDAKVFMRKEWRECMKGSFAESAFEIAIEALEQPERKKGKWIDETFKPWGLVYHPYKCDQCGEHSEADSDFCPNCGARMEDGE